MQNDNDMDLPTHIYPSRHYSCTQALKHEQQVQSQAQPLPEEDEEEEELLPPEDGGLVQALCCHIPAFTDAALEYLDRYLCVVLVRGGLMVLVTFNGRESVWQKARIRRIDDDCSYPRAQAGWMHVR